MALVSEIGDKTTMGIDQGTPLSAESGVVHGDASGPYTEGRVFPRVGGD